MCPYFRYDPIFFAPFTTILILYFTKYKRGSCFMKHDVAILEKLQCYTNLFTKLKLTSLARLSLLQNTP
jgi:hypothetical protein